MGATIIKVESMEGDHTRNQIGGNAAAFSIYNHGKKSLAINMGHVQGKKILYMLIKEADVVLENYRPGVADEIGIGYEDLAGINPNLVYCSIDAFGTTPESYAKKAGVDPLIQGMGGIMSVTGIPDGPPMLVGLPIADLNGAIYGYAALVTALYHRLVTGQGQKVSVSLIDTMVFSFSTRFAELKGLGRIPKAMGNAHSQVVPFQAVQTANGWITIAAITEEQWRRLCSALGASHLAEDPRYVSAKLRFTNREPLTADLNNYFRQKTSEEWIELLDSHNVMCGPIWNIQQVVTSDIVQNHGFIQTVSHPVDGTYEVLQAPFSFSRTPGKVQGPAPALGEDTELIMEALGFAQDVIKQLADEGIIKRV